MAIPTLDTMKVDATEAAWRMAGSQFVKLAKEPIIALLMRNLAPGDESFRVRIAAFLDTELGVAILSGVLSAGLSALPSSGNKIPERIAQELRVRSMATGGDVLADILMGPLRQVAVMFLQGSPSSDPALPPAALMPGNFPMDFQAPAATQAPPPDVAKNPFAG